MSGKTVTLRDVAQSDAERIFHWRNQDVVRRYMYNDQVIAPDAHARWFASLGGDAARRYWIIEFSGQPVGLVNFYDIRTSGRCASWAYYLAETATRGQGVGACVEYIMIEKAFGEMGLNKLWCEVLVSNEAVWKLHHGFGFVTEAHFRQHIIRSDGPQDVYGLGLLADDWAGIKDLCGERLRAKGFTL